MTLFIQPFYVLFVAPFWYNRAPNQGQLDSDGRQGISGLAFRGLAQHQHLCAPFASKHPMTFVNTSAAFEPAKAKNAFFSRSGDRIDVALFIAAGANDLAPLFFGTVAGKKVSVFLRKVINKQAFLSVVGDKPFGKASGEPVATANVRIVNGVPKLAMKMEGSSEIHWVGISNNIDDVLLARIGGDVKRIHRKEIETA